MKININPASYNSKTPRKILLLCEIYDGCDYTHFNNSTGIHHEAIHIKIIRLNSTMIHITIKDTVLFYKVCLIS